MGFVGEIIRFVIARKKFWMIPILLICIILGGIVVMSQGSAVAPFIYTIF